MLARATRARTGAAEGAALRDLDGRTYAGATVDLPSLQVSAVGVVVAMAVASGAKGAEAVVVLTEGDLAPSDLDALRDFAGGGVAGPPRHAAGAGGGHPRRRSRLVPPGEWQDRGMHDGLWLCAGNQSARRTGCGLTVSVTGTTQHQEAVRRLQASYDAIAPGLPGAPGQAHLQPVPSPRRDRHAGLDVSGLDGVISVDAEARTADVQGMCTYEDLVDATLPHGLIPLVVPQLRTITLGGAVTGLGIESTSFRNGLPHESVLEMDVFTGAGEVVTCTPDNEHADLFATFPNSYGSLGYATRLRIELEPVPRTSRCGTSGSPTPPPCRTRSPRSPTPASGTASASTRIDGTAFEPGEYYLTLGRWTDAAPGRSRATTPGSRSTGARSSSARSTC